MNILIINISTVANLKDIYNHKQQLACGSVLRLIQDEVSSIILQFKDFILVNFFFPSAHMVQRNSKSYDQ